MSHVCKSWREAVISYPLLWSTIDGNSEMFTRMCLERSKSLPLTVTLSNFDHWSRNTLALVGSQADRCEDILLEGSLSTGLSAIFSSMTPGEGPLILRGLSLVGRDVSPCAWSNLRSPILSKDIPTLHKLILSSFPLIPQLSVLRHLTDIDLDDIGRTSTNTLFDLLANNPSLQRVRIAGSLDNQEPRWGDMSIALPHLRDFRVSECDAVDILRCIHLPFSGPLEIDIHSSFLGLDLPEVYQPYSVIELVLDFDFLGVHLSIGSNFGLEIYDESLGGITAEFGELPPNTAEVLGPLTVQFIKYFHFLEDEGHPDWHPPEFRNALHHMQRLETLVLHCSLISFGHIFEVLYMDVVACPLLHTLIVQLPEDVPLDPWRDSLLQAVHERASRGAAIRRLRVILPSKEHDPFYSDIFDPFVQEIEVIAPEQTDRERWLVWED